MKMNRVIQCALPVELVPTIITEPTDHLRVRLFNALERYQGQRLDKPKTYGFVTFRINEGMYAYLYDISKRNNMQLKDVTAALLLLEETL